jgi:hypothetical protein
MIESARPAIDLTRYHFVRELGDIRLYGTWLYHPEDDDDEPCLVLVPAHRTYGVVPCCVALSAAFRYTDPRHLAAVSLRFAKDLGFEGSEMSAAHKIGSIIHDHLLDLIKMPENPTEAIVGATANVNFGDGRKRTVEIMDHVPVEQA